MLIRACSPADYPRMAEILNASWPQPVYTPEQMQAQEEASSKDGPGQMQYYVAEQNGQVSGVAFYDQPPRFYQPGKFRTTIAVAPHQRQQGIASALDTHLLSELRRSSAREIWTKLHEAMIPGIHFARARGFREETQIWELLRDISSIDLSPYSSLINKLQQQGIEIHTLQELLQADPGCLQKLYELFAQIGQDLPATEYWHSPTYTEFLGELARRSPAAYFIAHAGESYLGLSYLGQRTIQHPWTIGLTGVSRAERRRGIALALKVRGMAYAQQQGCRFLGTSVDAANQASLALNAKLGFIHQETWLVFSKKLTEVC
ncbi:MAG TPA: GNAT family N-acetyltransferase [Ktedonobacteraceae bacterium]